MKIAGIAGGKNRGDVIELSTNKKILVGVSSGLIDWANEYKDGKYLAFATDIEISSQEESPHGDLLKSRWANNTYIARGTLKLHLRNKLKDTMLEPKNRAFEIKFYDTLDSMGLPDLRVESLIIN